MYIDIKEQRGQYWLENIMKDRFAVSMFGRKRLSREGGIEIVVKELCTRMARDGCQVTCYNRSGHHVSGAEYDNKIEYDGIRQKFVPTIERKGLAAVSSSFFAALYSAFGKYDVVHIHIKDFKNSKYTFSFASDIFDEILNKLKCGYDVLFIGLPCQVAAIKNLVRITTVKGNLITVDLVCHGTPPPIYLQQHIKAIELKQKQKFTKCFFRDAKFDTSNFVYTLYTHNSEKPTYVKFVDENDNYQIGYHNALIYREVCYNCIKKYTRI